jgi:folate-binding protein YgfZ
MDRTPLYDKLTAIGATMGPYCGVETTLSFGDKRTEFMELVAGCGAYDLGWRARFRIGGADRVRWLNGMVTNNIRDLTPGHGNYNFVLSAQGRIQGDLYVYNLGDFMIAGTEREQVAQLMQTLGRYIIMDKVELVDLSTESAAIGVQGPKSRVILQRAGFTSEVGPLQITSFDWQGEPVMLTRMANDKFLTYEIWCSPAQAGRIWDSLLAAGAKPVGMDAQERVRVAAGIPRYGQDIHDRDLPQETGQQQALNFNKGCYVGQEIVERIRSRGQVHRIFTGLVIEGEPPNPGAKIAIEGKETGEVTSALRVPSGSGQRTLALGFVRREASKPGTIVTVDGVSATVAGTPFPEVLPAQ